jgi:hypothetical protein
VRRGPRPQRVGDGARSRAMRVKMILPALTEAISALLPADQVLALPAARPRDARRPISRPTTRCRSRTSTSSRSSSTTSPTSS